MQLVFSDGHATKFPSKFYEDFIDLNQIDWEVIGMRYWANTEEDPDRTRRRQAEFLVHKSFPWDIVESLAVKTPDMKRRLEKYLIEEWPDLVKPVRLERDWYF